MELGQVERYLICVLRKRVNMSLCGNTGGFDGSVRIMFYDRDFCRRAYCSAARIRKGIQNVYVRRRTVNRTDRDLIAKLAVGSVRTCLLRRDIIIIIDILRRNMQCLAVGKDNIQSVLTGVAARSDPTPAAQNVVDLLLIMSVPLSTAS